MQEQENVRMHVVVVTGMSGSGKSVVMDVLEDIGYYCIDNLPPQLIGKFVEICRESENHLQKLAIAADLRSGDMFTDAYRTLLEMKQQADLDATVFENKGKHYYVWAEKVGVGKQISNLYIGEMETPYKLKTVQVLLTSPDYDWERVGLRMNNRSEG